MKEDSRKKLILSFVFVFFGLCCFFAGVYRGSSDYLDVSQSIYDFQDYCLYTYGDKFVMYSYEGEWFCPSEVYEFE